MNILKLTDSQCFSYLPLAKDLSSFYSEKELNYLNDGAKKHRKTAKKQQDDERSKRKKLLKQAFKNNDIDAFVDLIG